MWQPTTFEVQPLRAQSFDDASKQAFGKALNHHKTAFEAACSVWKDTADALWASQFLANDVIVLEAKSSDNPSENLKLLDRDALAHKVLEYADETDLTGRFHTADHKDRLGYLRLYAELKGFIGKVDIHPTINNTNNTMKIVFVKPDNQKTIDTTPTIQHQEKLNLPKLKLVSGVSSS